MAIDPAAISYEAAALPRVATVDRCTDSVPPIIAGLHLGSTLDDLRREHPSVVIPAADEHGVFTVEATPAMINAPRSDDPAFDIMHITMKYRNDRLTNLRVLFSSDTSWATKDAFLSAAADRFSLHGPWRAFYDWTNRTLEDDEDIRELSSECTGYRIRLGLGYFSEGVKRVAMPHIKIDATP